MRPVHIVSFVLSLLAAPALADPERLIRQIEQSGAHAYQDERHVVEVDGCTLRTRRWVKRGEDWVLWTSLDLNMLHLDLYDFSDGEGGTAQHMGQPGTPDTGVVIFGALEGTLFEHKMHRDRARTTLKSEEDHFIQKKAAVAMLHQGPGAIEKAAAFSVAYQLYQANHCRLMG
ncbi:MAG: hypothetical protein AAGF71_07645 [Pseudomonadota bacterium]